jgi:hypothetical protein
VNWEWEINLAQLGPMSEFILDNGSNHKKNLSSSTVELNKTESLF